MDKIRLKVLIKRAIIDGIKYHYEMAELGRSCNFDQFAEDRVKDFETAFGGNTSETGKGCLKMNKNGDWVEYSEHKAIVEALTEHMRKHAATTSFCNCKGGPKGRTVTADFEHQICNECGKIAR